MSNSDEPENDVRAPRPRRASAPESASSDQLEQTGKNGANWFYWIAALSLVNTAVAHSGGESHFIVGLSLPAIADAMAIDLGKDQPANANAYVAVAIGFSVIVALVVFGFGWFSKKRVLWVYGIGMGLYLLDGLLYLLLQDFASVAFHAFALFSMFGGWSAFRKLAKQEDDDLPDDDEDQDDDTV